eukprot:4695328-Pleurochrysis_carterae.AAC.2
MLNVLLRRCSRVCCLREVNCGEAREQLAGILSHFPESLSSLPVLESHVVLFNSERMHALVGRLNRPA